MTKKNIQAGLTGLTAVIFGFLGKAVYRDYININSINDFGIAGFLPSFLYVIGFSLLLLIKPSRHPYLSILIVTTGSVLYEFKQYLSSSVIDINDILASVAGGLCSVLIYHFINSEYKLKGKNV